MPATTVQERIQKSLEAARQADELAKCKESRATGYIYFIRTYVKIYETREEYGIGWKDFELWPRQEEYLQFLETAYAERWREVVAEKPRDAGISYLTLAWIFAHWLFDEHFHALIGTLKEAKLALAPGHDTLFAKLRGFIEQLPPFLLPEKFNQDNHLLRLSLLNPANGNTILGEVGKENFGRSNRGGVVFRDESAGWDVDTSENTVYTAQLNIDVSTVNGLNHFYRQARAAKEQGHLFVFDRRDNPRQTDQWYKENLARARLKGAAAVAAFYREVDRNYKSGVEGQIYPMIGDCPVGRYEYRPDWTLETFWDYGFSDMGYVGFLQRDPDTGDLYLIDEVYNSQVGIEWFVPFIPGKIVPSSPYRYSPEDTDKILRHAAWRGGRRDWGDPTGNQRTAARAESVFDILKGYGIRPKCGPGWDNIQVRQQKASAALDRLHIDERCQYFIDSFTQFVIPKRAENSKATNAQQKGVHTWSHAPSAFEAFAISEPRLETEEERNRRQALNRLAYSDPWRM